MRRLLIACIIAAVFLAYFMWTRSSDVSRASDPYERFSAQSETIESVYVSHRADIIEAVSEQNNFGFQFHVKNLRNRISAVFVPADEFEIHITRLKVLNGLLESGFSGIDAVAALDEVLLN